MWRIVLRGGAYGGWGGKLPVGEPPEVLVAWRCTPRCPGHATFDPHEPAIKLRTAESYRRTEMDPETQIAIYDVGDGAPGPSAEERERVGVSGDLVPA